MSYSSSSSTTASSPRGGSVYDWLKDWRLWVALLVLLIALFFLYKKWSVIKDLGVGYGVADVPVPGASSLGSAISGIERERVEAELNAHHQGEHPLLSAHHRPRTATPASPSSVDEDLLDKKERLIEDIIGRAQGSDAVTLLEEDEEDEEEDNAVESDEEFRAE